MQTPVGSNKLLSKQVLPLERPSKTPIIISVAQFRPEKVGHTCIILMSTRYHKCDGSFLGPFEVMASAS